MKKVILILICTSCWALSAEASSLHNSKDNKGSEYLNIVNEGDRYMNDYDMYHAIPLYEKALGIETEARVIRNLAKCYFTRGYYRQSLNTINRLQADSIGHLDLKLKYDCYDNMSMDDSATLCGRMIADKYIYDSENINKLAGYFNSIEQADSALKYTGRYLSFDSTNIFVLRQQAYAYYKSKDFKKGMEKYDNLIAMGDSSLYTCFRMGLCCNGCDSLTKAYPYFATAARLSKFENPNILTQLGKSCINMGLYEVGIEYLFKAMEPAYSSLDVLFILNSSIADGYYKEQKYDLAAVYLENALKYNKKSYVTMFKIAQAYEMNKDFTNAKKNYKSLLDSLNAIGNPSESTKALMKKANDRLFLISKINNK